MDLNYQRFFMVILKKILAFLKLLEHNWYSGSTNIDVVRQGSKSI